MTSCYVALYCININVVVVLLSPFPATHLPAEIIPTKIRWLKLSGRSPMDIIIPPLKIKLCLSQTLRNPES